MLIQIFRFLSFLAHSLREAPIKLMQTLFYTERVKVLDKVGDDDAYDDDDDDDDDDDGICDRM